MESANDTITIVDTHEAYAGWTKMLIATVRLPDGHTLKREIEDHGEAVCVLPSALWIAPESEPLLSL